MISGLLPSPRISPDPNFSLRTNAPQIFKIKWFGDLIRGGKLFVQIFYPKMNPQKLKKMAISSLGDFFRKNPSEQTQILDVSFYSSSNVFSLFCSSINCWMVAGASSGAWQKPFSLSIAARLNFSADVCSNITAIKDCPDLFPNREKGSGWNLPSENRKYELCLRLRTLVTFSTLHKTL